MLLNLYLRRVREGRHGNNRPAYRVTAYRDQAMTVPVACWPPDRKGPTPSQPTVMMNCYRWNAVWLEETNK